MTEDGLLKLDQLAVQAMKEKLATTSDQDLAAMFVELWGHVFATNTMRAVLDEAVIRLRNPSARKPRKRWWAR